MRTGPIAITGASGHVGAGVRERHVPPSVARLLAHLTPQLSPTLVDVLLADSLPHDPSAAAALGIELRAPADVYARR